LCESVGAQLLNLAFLDYGTEHSNTVLELGYNLGHAYGHIVIAVPNAAKACEQIKRLGGKVIRQAVAMMASPEAIAFIKDRDAYKIELIEKD